MRYTVKIKLSAEKELDRIPDKFYQQIAKHIIALSTQPRPAGIKKLKEDVYRIRVGDYRIIYSVDDREKVVTIIKIGHRRKVYR